MIKRLNKSIFNNILTNIPNMTYLKKINSQTSSDYINNCIINFVNDSDFQNESFEDGMNSTLSLGIESLIPIYSNDLLKSIEHTSDKRIDDIYLNEIIRTIGRNPEYFNENSLIDFLSQFIDHPNIIVRDAVVIVLTNLETKKAYNLLENALMNETSDELCNEIQKSLDTIKENSNF